MFEERLDQLEALWKIYWLDSNSSELRQDIKSRLESAIQKWSLTDIEIVENGYVAFVLLARSNGKAVVLKLLPDNNELKREVEVLRLWKENTSVVNLLDSDDDNLTLLLERIEPGTTLDKKWS